MEIITVLAQELQRPQKHVNNAVTLFDEGCTVPFVARYRKEATGGMDEEMLRTLMERLTYLRNLEKRKEEVVSSITEQGKMDETILCAIEKATTLAQVEDIYRPYKPKRRTRATIAKEKGLEPLAQILLTGSEDEVEKRASEFVDPAKGVESVEDALQGAQDIVAEIIADSPDYREPLRELIRHHGMVAAKGEVGEHNYLDYLDYKEPVSKIPSHRILALNRGERENVLSVKIEVDEARALEIIYRGLSRNVRGHVGELLQEAAIDGYRRLLFPSLEREIRSELTERAEAQAISVFGKNLKQLLLQPPVPGKVVLAIDPAYRTGCKVAVVGATGNVLAFTAVYPTPPQNKVEEAREVLVSLIKKHRVNVIVIGNGTASRETERFVAGMIRELNLPLEYTIVSEAGASVYSASKLAKEELPDLDVSYRGAVSIGRRIQDPLAELVKIEPKSIGVGQYQHDVNQKKLAEELDGVVEDCVNAVGVDLNTASLSLLSYVAGINKKVAGNIIKFREERGAFSSREELKKVSGLGEKTFQQCAGFLRIAGGKDPLDNTAVHPESYHVARQLAGFSPEELKGFLQNKFALKQLAAKLEVGEMTLQDIVAELLKPGRDPRDQLPKPVFRTDVLEMEDLREGMTLTGTVRNVVDFGAFVDIGVHQDGLLHLSQIADKYIRHPSEVLQVGDVVQVKVRAVDAKRGRISLTMKDVK